MQRVVATFAEGCHKQLLDLSYPSMERLAKNNHADIVRADSNRLRVISSNAPYYDGTRPASWLKIPLMIDLLSRYDEILWIDADAIVVDDRNWPNVHRPCWQALVCHGNTTIGDMPNCGVWVVRRKMIQTLMSAWTMTHYRESGIWEQGAIVDLMGFSMSAPFRMPCRHNELYRMTQWLDGEWNMINDNSKMIIRHFTGLPIEKRIEGILKCL